MGMTMAQQILARSAGREAVEVGEALTCELSMVCSTDNTSFDWIDQNSLTLRHPDRFLLCFDHFIDPSAGLGTPSHAKLREFAQRHRVPTSNVFDVGRHGISHQVPVESGYALPGTFCVDSDMQAATMGAMNCFAIPVMQRLPQAAVTFDTWIVVPHSVRIDLRGKLPYGVMGKDVYLRILRDVGREVNGDVLEYAGPAIADLSIDLRMSIANGSNHIGAMTAIFPPDDRLMAYLNTRAKAPFTPVYPAPCATYRSTYEFDLSDFEPLVSGPDNLREIRSLQEVQGTQVQAAYVGSCSSGRLDDLVLAAEQLRGRRVHPDVRMVVTPISSEVMGEAARRGLIEVFAAAGATVTMPGCGACYFGNQSPLKLAAGETCITSSVENNPGRMGSDTASIYLANAGVVAASAVAGSITHPAPASDR